MDYNTNNLVDPARKMARTSLVLAIVAAISTCILPVYLPIVFGGLSLTFACLSMGYEEKMGRRAKEAVVVAGSAIVINIAIAVVAVVLVLFVPSYRQEFDDVMTQMYGVTLEEMLESIDGN